MQKILIIIGKQATGKTLLANFITEENNRGYAGIISPMSKIMSNHHAKKTIIIEDFTDIKELQNVINLDEIEIREPYAREKKVVKIPDLILITNSIFNIKYTDLQIPNNKKVLIIRLKRVKLS